VTRALALFCAGPPPRFLSAEWPPFSVFNRDHWLARSEVASNIIQSSPGNSAVPACETRYKSEKWDPQKCFSCQVEVMPLRQPTQPANPRVRVFFFFFLFLSPRKSTGGGAPFPNLKRNIGRSLFPVEQAWPGCCGECTWHGAETTRLQGTTLVNGGVSSPQPPLEGIWTKKAPEAAGSCAVRSNPTSNDAGRRKKRVL